MNSSRPQLAPLSPFKPLTPRPESFRSSFDFDVLNKRNENDGDIEGMFDQVDKSIDDLYQVLKAEEKSLKDKSDEIQGRYDQYETYHHMSQMKHHLKRALYHRRRFSTTSQIVQAPSMEETLETEEEEIDDSVQLRAKPTVVNGEDQQKEDVKGNTAEEVIVENGLGAVKIVDDDKDDTVNV